MALKISMLQVAIISVLIMLIHKKLNGLVLRLVDIGGRLSYLRDMAMHIW
jgi:archaellum biogenesis protein FlaJ (TadC family)